MNNLVYIFTYFYILNVSSKHAKGLTLTFKLIDAHILKNKTAPQSFKVKTVGFCSSPSHPQIPLATEIISSGVLNKINIKFFFFSVGYYPLTF